MNALPFRIKIALLSSVISGVMLTGFGVTAYFMVSRQKIEGLDMEIRSLGMRHRGWLANRQWMSRINENLAFILGENRGDEVLLIIKDEKGAILHLSKSWPAAIDPKQLDIPLQNDPEAPSPEDHSEGGFRGGRGWGGPGRGMGPGGGQIAFTKISVFKTIGDWRFGVMGTDDTTLVIGMNTRNTNAELKQLRNAFLLALPLALSLVGVGGWIVAGRAMRPLRAIAVTAEQVTASGLNHRIPASDDDPEITRVIQVLNRMMDRLEKSFQQATRFSADASHELKTPLAIMQGELENALQEAVPGSKDQEIFGNLLEETQRLKTITSGLLLLARADAGQLKPSLENLNFSLMLEGIIEDARLLAEESQLEFVVNVPPSVMIQADPGLLRTCLLNLLVNAVKYNEPSGRVEVTMECSAGQVVLHIGNTGPGIPDADRELVFTRFQRGDVSRQRQVDGIGLGLSLAREIIRAHGGDLELKESRPGWTSFVMKLNSDGLH